MKAEIKSPEERDNLDLLELVCQLHSRVLRYGDREVEEAYIEARKELEKRLQFTPVIGESGEEEKTVSIEEYESAMNEIAQLQEQLKQAEDEIIELSKFLDGPE